MKQFFKYLFATILGLFVFCFLIFLFFLGIGTSISKSAEKEKEVTISSNSILKLQFNTKLNDRPNEESSSISPLLPVSIEGNLGLRPTLLAIERAKNDDEIRGIYLDVNMVPIGYANINNLLAALEDFKTSGKFIIANSRYMSEKAYFLATAADEIYVHPEGFFEFNGLSINRTYLKEGLNKIGVEPMIFYAGKFKSATENLRRTSMSEESKFQNKEFLDDLFTNSIEKIAKNRGKSVEEIKAISNELKVRQVNDAVQLGLIDGLKYDDEIRAILKEKIGFSSNETLDFVNLLDYSKARKINANGKNTGDNRVAVVYAEGGIIPGKKAQPVQITGDYYASIIRKLRKDDKVKAVVLRVNSGGGSAFASDLIWREVELLKKEKPVVTSLGNYAASGGYYIACNTDKIYANESTITGSIGVFATLFNIKNLYEDKLGIYKDGIGTGKYSDFPNFAKTWTGEEKAIMQSIVNNIYDSFIGKVADGRKLSTEAVEKIAQGRVWSGEDAKEVGLVDEIGTLDDAIADAAKRAEVDNYKISIYPRTKSGFEKFKEMFNLEAQMDKRIEQELGSFSTTFNYLKDLEKNQKPMMAMPYQMEIE